MPRRRPALGRRCVAFPPVSTAPPPPPPAPPSTAVPPAPPVPASDARVRPGQLTRQWQVATVAMWGVTMLAFVGIWKASRELGLATWWKGPESEPQPFVVVLAPFYLPS